MGIISFLGSGQASLGNNASILIEAKNKKILIDAGPSIIHYMHRIFGKIVFPDYIILTHVHPDHVMGNWRTFNKTFNKQRFCHKNICIRTLQEKS